MLSRFNAVRRPAARGPEGAARSGLTLLEVLVALAIFYMSWVGIARLMEMATLQAVEARFQTIALQLAQSKMAEVVYGITPLQSQSDTPFDASQAPEGDTTWTWSVNPTQGEIASLWNVQVTIKRSRGDGSSSQVVLTQLVLDPSIRGSTLASPITSNSSSNSPGSTGSSGTSPSSP